HGYFRPSLDQPISLLPYSGIVIGVFARDTSRAHARASLAVNNGGVTTLAFQRFYVLLKRR
ncbi:hypothetical protein, partial [Pseudomonas sp. CF150]|uniref:hypothetical protein n=1 Tax=Pseudomonas sp. CF150 TaxID=911240 RepID=UPI001C43D06D